MKRIKTSGIFAILSICFMFCHSYPAFSRNDFFVKGFHLDLRIQVMKPEALGKLPVETIFIDWNYGWKPDRFVDVGKLVEWS